MAGIDGGSCRIYDEVRDSRALWDAGYKIDHKLEFSKEMRQEVAGLRRSINESKSAEHRTGRDFPRTPTGGVDEDHLRRGLEERRAKSFVEEIDSSQHRFYRKKIESEVYRDGWFCGHDEGGVPYQNFSRVLEHDFFNFKSTVPSFNGTPGRNYVLDWIDAVDDYFDQTNPPEDLKCKLAATKLKGEARTWWKDLQNHRCSEGKDLISSWFKMSELLYLRFTPANCLKNYLSNKQCEKSDYNDSILSHNNVSDNSIELTHEAGCCLKQIEREKKSTESCDEEDSLGKSPVDEQPKERVLVKSAKCLMKVPSQFSSNKQDDFRGFDSKDEFPYLGSISDDTYKTHVCEDVTGHDVVIDNKETQVGKTNEESDKVVGQEASVMNHFHSLILTREIPFELSISKGSEVGGTRLKLECPALYILHEPLKNIWTYQLGFARNPYLQGCWSCTSVGLESTWGLLGSKKHMAQFLLLTYSDGDVFLFDPGGDVHLSGNEDFKDYPFSCSKRLVGNITDTMIFTLYLDNVPVMVGGGLLFELFGRVTGNPYVEEDDFALCSWKSQNVFVFTLHMKGYAQEINVLGITEVQEMLFTRAYNAPEITYAVIAQLSCRYSRWDNWYFRKYMFMVAGEVKLKFKNRRNYGDLDLFGKQKTTSNHLNRICSETFELIIEDTKTRTQFYWVYDNDVVGQGSTGMCYLGSYKVIRMMVDGYYIEGELQDVIQVFNSTWDTRCMPNSPFILIVFSCSERILYANGALSNMMRAGLEPNVFVLTSLIHCFERSNVNMFADVCDAAIIEFKGIALCNVTIFSSSGKLQYVEKEYVSKTNKWNGDKDGTKQILRKMIMHRSRLKLGEANALNMTKNMSNTVHFKKKRVKHKWDRLIGDTTSVLIVQLSHDIFISRCILHTDTSLNQARGRAIPWEGWNDVNNYDTIIAKLSIVTTSSCLGVLCMNGRPRDSLKLFHNVVNGLDPPMDLDGACETLLWILMSSLVGELFEWRGWNDVGTTSCQVLKRMIFKSFMLEVLKCLFMLICLLGQVGIIYPYEAFLTAAWM